MKWSEIERMAIKKGWCLKRHGAEHDAYEHPDRDNDDVLYIARHKSKEVPNGTFRKVKKQIGF